jgi:hypothetical protein
MKEGMNFIATDGLQMRSLSITAITGKDDLK